MSRHRHFVMGLLQFNLTLAYNTQQNLILNIISTVVLLFIKDYNGIVIDDCLH